jgi:hypothetical protein
VPAGGETRPVGVPVGGVPVGGLPVRVWMGVRTAAVLLLGLAAAAPGGSPTPHPPFAPTRDVSVVYRLESPDAARPGGESSEELHLYAEAGGRRLRLDTPDAGGYLLIDPAARTAAVVNPGLRAFMTVPLNPKLARGLLLLDPSATFTRQARATVAGLVCTVWAIGGKAAAGSVCVTDDGVILRRVEGGDPARQSRLTALSVTYAPQLPALFAPPDGFQDLSPGKAPPAIAAALPASPMLSAMPLPPGAPTTAPASR